MRHRYGNVCAACNRMTRNDKKTGFVLLGNALEAVPGWPGNFPELSVRVLFKIQNRQRQVTIPQNQVRRFQCLSDVVATNPEQKWMIDEWLKTILAVDQRDILRSIMHRFDNFM